MSAEQGLTDRQLVNRWVLNTFGGWVLGFAFIVLGAMGAEALATEEGQGSQLIVGLGMGAGVGVAQWRIAKKWFGASGWWAVGSALGMALPFLVLDLFGSPSGALPQWAVLLVQVLSGGLLAGLFQFGALKPHSDRAAWWVLASALGWLLSAGVVSLTAVLMGLPGSWAGVVNFGLIFFGGVVLGYVTGKTLVWMLRK